MSKERPLSIALGPSEDQQGKEGHLFGNILPEEPQVTACQGLGNPLQPCEPPVPWVENGRMAETLQRPEGEGVFVGRVPELGQAARGSRRL